MSPLRTNIEVVHPVIEVDGSIETPSLHVQNHVWRLYSLKKIIYTFTQMNGDHIIMNWLSEEEHGPWPQEECLLCSELEGNCGRASHYNGCREELKTDRHTHTLRKKTKHTVICVWMWRITVRSLWTQSNLQQVGQLHKNYIICLYFRANSHTHIAAYPIITNMMLFSASIHTISFMTMQFTFRDVWIKLPSK